MKTMCDRPGPTSSSSASRRDGGEPGSLLLRVTSDTEQLAAVRRTVEAYAAGGGLDETRGAEVGLAVNEALANVIRHAYRGRGGQPVEVGVDCDGSNLQVRIRDWGNGVNPVALMGRPHDPERPGGLGLVCLRALMDTISFHPQPDGMLLVMTKKLPVLG